MKRLAFFLSMFIFAIPSAFAAQAATCQDFAGNWQGTAPSFDYVKMSYQDFSNANDDDIYGAVHYKTGNTTDGLDDLESSCQVVNGQPQVHFTGSVYGVCTWDFTATLTSPTQISLSGGISGTPPFTGGTLTKQS